MGEHQKEEAHFCRRNVCCASRNETEEYLSFVEGEESRCFDKQKEAAAVSQYFLICRGEMVAMMI